MTSRFTLVLSFAALAFCALAPQSVSAAKAKKTAPAKAKKAAPAEVAAPLNLGPVPGVVIDASPDPQRVYIGSPSLAVLPDGTYVASHDFFGPGTTFSRSAVFGSADRGQSWKKLSEIEGQWWSTLFVHRGALYILGVAREHGDMVIRRSNDGGKTWTTPVDGKSGLLYKGLYHCAPTPVVFHKGRIWRAFEQSTNPKNKRAFESLVISAPEDADLLDVANWTRTNNVKWEKSWVNAPNSEWLEGNVVVTPEGGLVNILRFNADCGRKGPLEFTGAAAGNPRYETAVMLTISDDGKTLTYDPKTSFFPFPGAGSKFTIRYDEKSGRYWALVQKITNFEYQKNNPFVQRNVLALTSSADLRHWEVSSIILRWNEGAPLSGKDKVGFQYVDWLFDGDDIIAACRTAWDGHNYHDANYLTFHRIKGFRGLTMKDSPPDLAGKTAKKAGKTAGVKKAGENKKPKEKDAS